MVCGCDPSLLSLKPPESLTAPPDSGFDIRWRQGLCGPHGARHGMPLMQRAGWDCSPVPCEAVNCFSEPFNTGKFTFTTRKQTLWGQTRRIIPVFPN